MIGDSAQQKLFMFDSDGQYQAESATMSEFPVSVETMYTGSLLEDYLAATDPLPRDEIDKGAFLSLFHDGTISAGFESSTPDLITWAGLDTVPTTISGVTERTFVDIALTKENHIYVCGSVLVDDGAGNVDRLHYLWRRDGNTTSWSKERLFNKCAAVAGDNYQNSDTVYVALGSTIRQYDGLAKVAEHTFADWNINDIAGSGSRVVLSQRNGSTFQLSFGELTGSGYSAAFLRPVAEQPAALAVHHKDMETPYVWHSGSDGVSTTGNPIEYFLHRYEVDL